MHLHMVLQFVIPLERPFERQPGKLHLRPVRFVGSSELGIEFESSVDLLFILVLSTADQFLDIHLP